MKHTIFILLILLATSTAYGVQELQLNTKNLRISDQRKGENSVIDTVQDNDGYIWIASIQGLYVYDGNLIRQALTEYLHKVVIRDIHIDSDNQLWVATHTGAFVYSLTNRSGTWLTPDLEINDRASRVIQKIYEDPFGTIWLGTSNGLYRYEKTFGKFQHIPVFPGNGKICIKDLCVDVNRQFWVATNKGLFLLSEDMKSSRRIPLDVNDAPKAAANIATDSAGHIWASIAQRGVQQLSVQNGKHILRSIDTKNDLPHQCNALRVDSVGDLWIGTTQGIFRYSPEQQRFFRHPLQDTDWIGDTPLHIASVAEGKTGSLWVGTFNNGGFQFVSNTGTQQIDIISQIKNHPTKLLGCYSQYNPYDKSLWVAPKSGGLYRSSAISAEVLKNCKQLHVDKIFTGKRIHVLFLHSNKGVICGASEDELLYFPHTGGMQNLQFLVNEPASNNANNIIAITETSGGDILLADKANIFTWTPGGVSPPRKLDFDKMFDHGGIRGIAADGNAVYIGATKGTFRFQYNPNFNGRVECEQLSALPVTALAVDSRHRIWIGSSQGTLTVDPTTKTETQITLATGAPILNAQSFWEAHDGDIWTNTLSNIIHIPANSERGNISAVGASNPSESIIGLPGRGPSEEIVFGHTNGILLVNPKALTARATAKIVISDIRIFDQPLLMTPDGRLPQSIELSHNQNYITFGFSALDFGTPKPARYVYRMLGLDTEWHEAGSRNYASFGNLSPGDYTFTVRDPDGSTSATAMSIHISPPIWLAPWAKAAYTLCAAVLVMGSTLLFSRLQRHSIRQEMLEHLVMQDSLTAIPNRRKFEEVLQVEKSRCARTKNELSLIMIDIDYFKGFNDRFGHQKGDDVLRKVATALKISLQRPEDFVARYGGEEFVAVLPNTSRHGAEHVAEALKRAVFQLEIPYPNSPVSDRVTISLGVSSFAPETDLHIETGLFSADQALYQAKRAGRNCIIYREHILGLSAMA